MNYMILQVTAKFAKTNTSSMRLFLGSLIGAGYVVLILFPGMKVFYTAAAKFALSFLIIAVTFTPDKISSFVKTLAIFYLSSFIFAGAAFCIIYFNGSGGFVKNGIIMFWWNQEWTVLLFGAITAGIIGRTFWEVIQNKFIKEKFLVTLKIAFESKIVDIAALIDTGNSLHDPITNMPVVVVEFMAIKEILPNEIKSIFEESKENDLGSVTSIVSNSQWFSRFRLIPFNSLGKENGMLIGFRPDYIEIGDEKSKKGVSNVIVGIYNRELSKNEKYRALLSPELVA